MRLGFFLLEDGQEMLYLYISAIYAISIYMLYVLSHSQNYNYYRFFF